MTVRCLHGTGEDYEVSGEGPQPIGEIRRRGKQVDLAGDGPLRANAALFVAGMKSGGERDCLEKESPRLGAFSFDSERRRGSVVRASSW
jgi:hypothetical protein